MQTAARDLAAVSLFDGEVHPAPPSRPIYTSVGLNLQEIGPGLTKHEDGYWLAPEEIATSYSADRSDFCLSLEEDSFWFAHRNRAITAAVARRPPADGPLFDVGGGNGLVTSALQKAGFSAITIEPSRAGAANAVRRGIADVICGSLPSSAILEKTAGAIGLFDVIEHVPDDVGFLRALHPYLRQGGRVYITVPAYQWLWSANDVRAGHYRRYTRRSLRRVLETAGYRLEYSTYIFWALPLPILLLRTLRAGKRPDDERSRSQHRAGGAAARRIIEACVSFEIGRIARGTSTPFGGTCLAVASVAAETGLRAGFSTSHA